MDVPLSSIGTPFTASAALSHHWLVRPRGGEHVLEALAELVPDAAVYTLVYDRGGMAGSPLVQRRVHTSPLQWLPGSRRYYPNLLPLMPWAARWVRLPPVDLVLCSDAALAKAMRVAPGTKLVCYCHSPMRYVWDLSDVYAQTLPRPARPAWRVLCRWLQSVDRRAAQRVDLFLANSHNVAQRIRRHYGRESIVVHPPVALPPRPVYGQREDFFLAVGYHVRYKRLDLAVEATRRLGRRLVVVGEGPDVLRLQTAANSHVEFRGWLPDAAVRHLYSRARALLFPGEEDFGIVPVEAMSHGCPVVAYAAGGALETVRPRVTGVLFEQQTTDGLLAGIAECEAGQFDAQTMFDDAQRFSKGRFLQAVREAVTALMNRG